jgi:ketosteroid isomerase-like protein
MSGVTSAQSISAITDLLHRYYEAFHRRDWKAFAMPLDDGFRYFTDNATVQSQEEFLSFLMNDPWEPTGYSMSELQVHVAHSNDLAVATYRMQFDGIHSGKTMSIIALETAVLRLIENEWKMVHFHSSNVVR